jgi:hypothetical protein
MRPGFNVLVMTFCRCGWLMQDSPSGTYCVNPQCLLKTRLYQVKVDVQELQIPQGAAA